MMMKFSAAVAVTAFVVLTSPCAFALDQLLLPQAPIQTVSAEIREFASQPNPTACSSILKNRSYASSEDKIRAIRAYRQCRADRTLAQLAVWKWQDNFN